MFTGIVEEVGKLKATVGNRYHFLAHKVHQGTQVGDSINVNGACLTVTSLSQDGFTVEVMPVTRQRTNLGQLRPGQEVNLERALPVAGRLGGHIVQGHVDATGQVLSLFREGEAVVMEFAIPQSLMAYIVPQGFIAVDGVSLTVVSVDGASFRVSLVAHTLENTNLRHRRPGDRVNLEVDVLAKYVEKLKGGQGISLEWLGQKGFLEVSHAA